MSLSVKNAVNGKSVKPQRTGRTSLPQTSSPAPDLQSPTFADDLLSPTELAEIWAQRAYALAQEPPPAVTGQTVTLLIFRLNSERYSIEVAHVHEIYPREQLTPVPRTPAFVAGVFSARGRILSVIDLRTFFGLPASAPNHGRAQAETNQTKIIVVANTDTTSETTQVEVGLLVDEVIDVQTIFIEEIEAPLTTQDGIYAHHIRGVTSDLLVVLDLNALLSDKQLVIKDEL
ncbi:MAG: purine-binding chemotaxis protein CheW [Anaerolineales bacterium]|nr:purine-binding chemotaxis protein CheW [Anaerolineales bacterium]